MDQMIAHAGSYLSARRRELFVALVIALVPASHAELPPLKLDAPESLIPVVRQIESMPRQSLEVINRLIGAPESDEPVEILLAPENSALASRTPSWVSGYAIGETSRIVLFPSRAHGYPDDGLPELLRHELAHILIHRASAGQPIPRWFHEGLAVTAGGRWDLEDRTRLTIGMMSTDDLDLEAVEAGFRGTEFEIHRSYAMSLAFVRHLLREFGQDAPRAILDRVSEGTSFQDAFLDVTGRSLPLVERDFWRSRKIWNRWIPLLTSSFALWTAITLLALWAIARRRRRDAKIRQMWELEEELVSMRNSNIVEHPKRDEWIH
ncbi:MAG: peptidase MA family metallohydrolase [Thermoanaerobaculia bacterium]|nr:peptidase MA family metallohydrolase [Thermoanaerobaculia bacterium]